MLNPYHAMKELLYILLCFCYSTTAQTSSKCTIGDCLNGQGTCFFSNGDKYVGEFRDDKLHGNGALYLSSGDKYVGQFYNGSLNGKGTYSFNTGAIYVGGFEENKIHGQGSITYSNGDNYVGEFSLGSRYGYGTITYANGDVYKGEFKNDVAAINLSSIGYISLTAPKEIQNFMEMYNGCTCSFESLDQDFGTVLAADVTLDIALIRINNIHQIIKSNVDSPRLSNDKYTVYIQNQINCDQGYESETCDAELVVIDNNGNKIIKKVRGGCGC